MKAERLVGESRPMRELGAQIERLAPTDHWLWIIGDSGTGKGLVARIIHALSRRRGPFVELNSERLRSSLRESTLLGHAKYSFTGAERDQKGRYEQADQGTLFFSEGARTRRAAQGLLLEAFDCQGFSPIGDSRQINPDVRVLFGSSVEPNKLLEDGTLEEHFFYRLGCIHLRIPPLRQRAEDIPGLVALFSRQQADRYGREMASWEPGAIDEMMAAPWLGNVRQLANVVAAAEALSDGFVSRALVTSLLNDQPAAPCRLLRGPARDQMILSALRVNRGNIARTSKLLNVSENTIRRALKRSGEPPTDFRSADAS